MCSELFLGGNLLGILNSSEKLLKCAWQLFVTQISFKIEINLDPTIGLRGLGTFNVHIIYITFFMTILGDMFH
jgi:hypothetical protein